MKLSMPAHPPGYSGKKTNRFWCMTTKKPAFETEAGCNYFSRTHAHPDNHTLFGSPAIRLFPTDPKLCVTGLPRFCSYRRVINDCQNRRQKSKLSYIRNSTITIIKIRKSEKHYACQDFDLQKKGGLKKGIL